SDNLSAEKSAKVAVTVSHYTGLAQSFVENSDLRISADAFRVQLLKDQNVTLSYYDARMKAVLATPQTQDPSDAFTPIFAAVESNYFGLTLGISTTLPYQDNNWPS